MSSRLYAFILTVSEITQAEGFYSRLLQQAGKRISPGRHSFCCGGVIITCYDAKAEGTEETVPFSPSSTICLSVTDLDQMFERAKADQCVLLDEEIISRPWGARSFRVRDPFGNVISLVDETTMQQQISEHSAAVETPLKVGMELTLHGLGSPSAKGMPARVEKIFPGHTWLTLIPANGVRFAPGERVQIRFIENQEVFSCDSRVIEISPSGSQHIAVVVPKEADVMERRLSSRYPCDLSIWFSAAQSPLVPPQEMEARVWDISTGGVKIESELAPQPGKRVKLRLSLGEMGSVEASATVAWSEPIHRHDVITHLTGLRFMQLSLDDEIKILQYLIDAQEKEAARQ